MENVVVTAPAVEMANDNVWGHLQGPIPEAVADVPPRVYVPHEMGGDLVVIDPLTKQIVDRYWLGRVPHHVSPAYDMSALYVNVMSSNMLVEIDPRAGRPTRTIPVHVPYNMYFTPDGTRAVVAAEMYNRLDFYDAATWQPLVFLPIGISGVNHLDFSADGSYLLVSGEFDGHVARVDVDNMVVDRIARLGRLPVDSKVSADGSLFYVADQGRHGVILVDPEAMQEVGFLPTGAGAHSFAVSRDGSFLFCANRLAGTISVIEFASAGVLDTWRVGGSPDMLQVSPDGTELWASGRYHGEVIVVDTATGVVTDRIRTGAAPHGLTYFPQPGRFSLGHNGVYR